MARTPMDTTQPDTEMTPVQEKNVNELIEAGQQASIAQAAVLDNFEAIKSIGRLEASQFYATVAEKLIVETALSVREGKKYKGLPYKKENGETATVATFEEFCEVFLGKSYRRVQELITNYNQLGADLFEKAERLGFRQRDYNALKALPADDRALIAQAIEEENLDKALDIMQEMAAKHVREKEALTKQTEELSKTLEAREQVVKAKSAKIDEQAEKLALLENAKRTEAPVSAEQRLIDARANLQIAAANIKAQVMADLRKYLIALNDIPGNHALFAAGLLAEIARELNVLRDEYDLPATISDDVLTDPTWAAINNSELQG